MARELVSRIQRDAAAVLLASDMKDTMLAQGCIPVGGTPGELTTLIQNEYALWSRVVKAGNVRLE